MTHPASADTDAGDLARGAGVNYLGYAIRLGARAPFLLVAALLYGETRFGEYVFGLSVVETVAALALFGMKRSLFKFMHEAAARQESVHRVVANGIALAMVAGTLTTIAVAATAFPLAHLLRVPTAAPVLLLLTLAIPLIVASDILLIAIRYTRQMRFEVIARSIVEPLTLSAVAVAAWYLGAQDYGLVVAYVVSLTIAAATTMVMFARVFGLGDCLRAPLAWAEMRRLITFSGPTAGYDLLILLSDQVDVYLVAYFFPASTVGIYGMARQFATFTRKIRQGFDRILPPVLSNAIHTGDLSRVGNQLALVSRWILSVQVLLILGFALLGDNILGLLGGNFSTGALVLTLLLVGDTINGSLGINELPIVYLRPRLNLLIGGARLVLSVGLGIWMTHGFGLEGVAGSVALTYVVVNAFRITANWRLFQIRAVNAGVLKPILAALPATATALVLQGFLRGHPTLQLVVALPLTLAIYLGAWYALGLEREELGWLTRWTGRR